jgi:hypothetical protein
LTQTQPISVAAKRSQPVNRIITQSTGSKAALLAGAVAIGLILYADVLHLAFGMSISAYVLLAILGHAAMARLAA